MTLSRDKCPAERSGWELWANGSKFNKNKCRILHLGRSAPVGTFLTGVGDHVAAAVTQKLCRQHRAMGRGSRGASRTRGLGEQLRVHRPGHLLPRAAHHGVLRAAHPCGACGLQGCHRVPRVRPVPGPALPVSVCPPSPFALPAAPRQSPEAAGLGRAGWGVSGRAMCPLFPAQPEGQGPVPFCASVSPEALQREGAPRTRSSPCVQGPACFWGEEGSTWPEIDPHLLYHPPPPP